MYYNLNMSFLNTNGILFLGHLFNMPWIWIAYQFIPNIGFWKTEIHHQPTPRINKIRQTLQWYQVYSIIDMDNVYYIQINFNIVIIFNIHLFFNTQTKCLIQQYIP